jgi:hypothetical protein
MAASIIRADTGGLLVHRPSSVVDGGMWTYIRRTESSRNALALFPFFSVLLRPGTHLSLLKLCLSPTTAETA